MAILCDHEIHNLARRGLVSPFLPELVNPASLDVRLGENLLVELPTTTSLVPYSIAGHTKEKPFMLQPHEFVLAETAEEFSFRWFNSLFQEPEVCFSKLLIKLLRFSEF